MSSFSILFFVLQHTIGWWYIKPFRHSIWMWQTDGRTDRRTKWRKTLI